MRQPQLAHRVRHDLPDADHRGRLRFSEGRLAVCRSRRRQRLQGAADVDGTFVRRYAARIPALELGKPRSVFGAILFPVLPAVLPGNYDELFIEAADYDDGFAKIVHAFQPVSNSLLLEKSDGFHPTKEVGIRLGWDDEQILIWYIRQLAEDPSVGPAKRIDAPIGAFGYKIDVRENKQPPVPWESLNQVSSKAPLTVVDPVTHQVITLGDFTDKDLTYQVYPAQLDGDLERATGCPCTSPPGPASRWCCPTETRQPSISTRRPRRSRDEREGPAGRTISTRHTTPPRSSRR